VYPKEIVFSQECDKDNYDFYIKSRGIGVYEDALRALLLYTDKCSIEYYDFMGFIRYDKSLRDILYKMLAVLEEFLKDNIFKKVEYIKNHSFKKISKDNIDKFQMISDENYGWTLYRNLTLDFGSLLYLYDHFRIILPSKSKDFVGDLKNIKSLRNLVMHHHMLLIDQSKPALNKYDIDQRVKELTQQIISLYNILQPDYDKGLITGINKANYDKDNDCIKSKYIYIEKLDGGFKNDII